MVRIWNDWQKCYRRQRVVRPDFQFAGVSKKIVLQQFTDAADAKPCADIGYPIVRDGADMRVALQRVGKNFH
jgi:hypothetical protein